MDGVAVANAPVSYGAFERTVGIMAGVPEGGAVLDEVAAAGYAGIDLGPVGYLGSKNGLAAGLQSRGLSLSGGFFQMPFGDRKLMPPALVGLGSLLDVFDEAASGQGLRPKPTLADVGSDLRRSRPGQAVNNHSLGFDEAGWKAFAVDLEAAVAVCRERGYEPTFHPETGTRIEAPWEIEKVLELTSIGLCLDTGHMLLGGGDPVLAMREWSERINHLHLKDARRSVVQDIIRDAAPVIEIWRRRAFCRLGEGDVDVEALLDQVRDFYSGWIVVEQDVLPGAHATAVADQRANRAFLAARGF